MRVGADISIRILVEKKLRTSLPLDITLLHILLFSFLHEMIYEKTKREINYLQVKKKKSTSELIYLFVGLILKH